MKRKDAIKALEETLNKWEGLGEHCKLGIVHDFRKQLLIQKYGIKSQTVTYCTFESECEIINKEEICKAVREYFDRKNRTI